MASVFGHGLVAYTTAKVLDSKSNTLLVFLAIGSAILPDLDVLSFRFGIDYMHPLGHRGFTHSIVFALTWSVLLAVIFGKTRKLIFAIVIFLSTISHGILDAMTTGGRGVGFFIPFENSRHFFPYRVIEVSPLGIERFFSEWGLRVIVSEFKYIGIPCCIILITLYVFKKRKKSIL
ncbi:metal-dependent hydrolase [Psychroserpens luteolus]|uniref:metal-dependent hydrolase n=1 Tax=Psychroserpens luteolus TaxID=2855840 RepID=UPI001E4F547A|nr:metal-dependent hydrolase [Psychroserpens luteolus]MCD2260712.1 metal-dependent hydrolase [Psychroserpens luteolus]